MPGADYEISRTDRRHRRGVDGVAMDRSGRRSHTLACIHDRPAAVGYSRCDPHGDRPSSHCGLARAQVTALGSTTTRNQQMPTGTVKFFNESKGFGFIQPEGGGADAFVHISDVERSGMSTLRENQRVSYDVEQDQRGKMKATNLKSADGE